MGKNVEKVSRFNILLSFGHFVAGVAGDLDSLSVSSVAVKPAARVYTRKGAVNMLHALRRAGHQCWLVPA